MHGGQRDAVGCRNDALAGTERAHASARGPAPGVNIPLAAPLSKGGKRSCVSGTDTLVLRWEALGD